MEEKIAQIWLSRIPNLGSKRLIKLLQKYQKASIIENLSKSELMTNQGIGEKIAEEMTNFFYKENLNSYVEYMKKEKIELISILDKNYPVKLKRIWDPPAFLYVKGNKEILNEFNIAMVGSRKASFYGKKIASKLAYQLTKQNIHIISGLAKGIDSYSHIGCVQAKGKTIAVLGHGLDTIYPAENKRLADQLLTQGGTLLSEYPLGSPIQKMNFPARNRIISGLSEGIVVVEAGLKSGSMITVEFALEEGKAVFAVPGNIDVKTSQGTNEILKQGAKLVTQVEDILEEYL